MNCKANSLVSLCHPLASNYTVIPNVAFPYAGVLQNYKHMCQTNPNFQEGFLNGLQITQALEKNSVWPGRILALSNFIVVTTTNWIFHLVWRKLGLLASPPRHDFQMLGETFLIFWTRQRLDFAVAQRQELTAEIQQNPDKQFNAMKDLAEIENSIVEFDLEITSLENKLHEKLKEFEEYQKNPLGPSGSMRDVWVTFLTSSFSNAVANSLVYPFYLVGSWYVAQMKITTWTATCQSLWTEYTNGRKNPWDGFFVNTLRIMCHKCLMLAPMEGLKRVMNIPDEVEMSFHFNYCFAVIFSDYCGHSVILNSEAKKQQLHSSFSILIKNSVAHTISSWIAGMILYPVSSIQAKLAFQGCPGSSESFSGIDDAITKTYASYGFGGFYNGFFVQSFLIVPQLLMLGGVYAVGKIAIEFYYSEEQ